MNKSNLKVLGAAVIILFALLATLEFPGREQSATRGELLFPDLKPLLNEIGEVAVTRHGADGTLTIVRNADNWTVTERGGYVADIGKIREVLLAIAEARVLEQKTSDPERYQVLGIETPDAADSAGVAITLAGDDFAVALIVGNTAQSDYRYVRIADQAQGLLIDRNPDIPASASGWLLPDIVNIDAANVRAVTITHPDGEAIHLAKESAEDDAYAVNDIPAGRDLSYPGVANGIAGVLSDLKLEDVRKSEPGERTATAKFETFDGLQLSIPSYKTADGTWIALVADGGVDDQAAAINERVAGWQYRIADYKANLLMRRWEDILKTPAADE